MTNRTMRGWLPVALAVLALSACTRSQAPSASGEDAAARGTSGQTVTTPQGELPLPGDLRAGQALCRDAGRPLVADGAPPVVHDVKSMRVVAQCSDPPFTVYQHVRDLE